MMVANDALAEGRRADAIAVLLQVTTLERATLWTTPKRWHDDPLYERVLEIEDYIGRAIYRKIGRAFAEAVEIAEWMRPHRR